MELRHLRYFVVLAEELHFGRAASRLAITQPPLSFNIKQLEEELGTLLLERDNKHVALTQAGAAFYAEAVAIITKADRARAQAKGFHTGTLGRLDVGFSGSMIYGGMRGITEAYLREQPAVELILHDFGLPEQIEGLKHGNLDIALCDSPSVPEGLAGFVLVEEAYVCCIRDDHPLAGEEAIGLALLASENFVSFARKGAPTTYDRVISMCVSAGFTPRITHTVRQWLTIIALVSERFGVALVPARMANAGFHGVRFVPLAGDEKVKSTGYVLWNPDFDNARTRQFIACARVVVAESTSNTDPL